MTTDDAILSVRLNISETRDSVDKYGLGPQDSEILALVDCETLERLCAEAERVERLVAVLGELAAMVRGECPSLLDDLRGGNSMLDIEIDKALGAC